MENRTTIQKKALLATGVTGALILGMAYGAGTHDTALGIGLLTACTLGIGVIFGMSLNSKNTKATEVRRA